VQNNYEINKTIINQIFFNKMIIFLQFPASNYRQATEEAGNMLHADQ